MVQYPDIKPNTLRVRFNGKIRYTLAAITTPTNIKNVIEFPANYMGNPTFPSGTWTQESMTGSDFIQNTATYYSQYNYNTVISSSIIAVAKVDDLLSGGQTRMIQFLRRANVSGTITSSDNVLDLEKDYGTVTSHIGAVETPQKTGYNKIGYSPTKQFAIKDYKDNADLRALSSYGTAPNTDCFFVYAVSGLLDTDTKSNQDLIIEFNVSYLVEFQEPTNAQIPL